MKTKDEIQSKYNLTKGGDWLNLKEGANVVRVVSDFVDYGIHSVKENDKYKSVPCVGKENDCPYCVAGVPVKVQFLGWVIDRADAKVKLLRIGWMIYQEFIGYKDNEEYTFDTLPPWDMTIQKTGTGLETKYKVLPSRKDTKLTTVEEDAIMKVFKEPAEIIEKMKDKVSTDVEVVSEKDTKLTDTDEEEITEQ